MAKITAKQRADAAKITAAGDMQDLNDVRETLVAAQKSCADAYAKILDIQKDNPVIGQPSSGQSYLINWAGLTNSFQQQITDALRSLDAVVDSLKTATDDDK